MLKRFLLLIALLAALCGGLSLTGCGDTWHGFGEDVEDVGEDIQE
jgi:predicted small secreted protein